MGNRKGTQAEKPKRDVERKCLWCMEMFMSYGPQNRQCPRCKSGARARGYQSAHYHDQDFRDGEIRYRTVTRKTPYRRWC